MPPLAARSAVPSAPRPPRTDAVVRSLVTEFAEEKVKERELEVRQRRRRKNTLLVPGLVVACLGAWLLPFPRPASAAQSQPIGFTMASGRLTLLLAARRIETFRARHRRLPSTLTDAGIDERGMSYTPSRGATFIVQLPVGEALLTFDSSMSPAVFVDDAKDVVKSTGR